MLNLANSAFYGFARMITTIPQAVVVLGFDTVRSLALGVSVFDTLSQSSEETGLDREVFWIHSIGCGTASRLIAKELGYRDTGTFFVVGLLHDLGKVILDTYFHAEYEEIVKEMVEEGRSSYDVEADHLNIDHAEVGGWLAFWWKFPDVLIAPIEGHHNPLSVDEQYLKEAVIAHLANVLVKRAGIGACYENLISEPSDLVESALGLSSDQIARITEELRGEKERIEEFFNYLKG